MCTSEAWQVHIVDKIKNYYLAFQLYVLTSCVDCKQKSKKTHASSLIIILSYI